MAKRAISNTIRPSCRDPGVLLARTPGPPVRPPGVADSVARSGGPGRGGEDSEVPWGVSLSRWHRQHGVLAPGVTGRPRSAGETSVDDRRPLREGPDMNVPTWIWFATVGALVGVILVDLFMVDHNPHAVTMREATRWVLFYMALAAAFGGGLWLISGPAHAGEFFAGYITEYSLSVDNLFIFVIIMSAFRVPAIHQHRVLLVGIVIALIMRGVFIAVGAAAIAAFSWVFYLFAVLLFVTALRLVTGKDDDHEYKQNASLKLLRRVVPVTDEFHGARTPVKLDGRRHFTPM